MIDEPTPPLEEGDRQQARALSLQGLGAPLHVPGYEQEQFLGKGTYGEVWRAIDSNNGRQVAIKFYHRRGGLDWALLSREVEKLRHLFGDRHVVQLFAVGWDADPPYYVMEYMEHGSLEERLRQGPLPVDQALEVFHEVAVGLVHAHSKGILHCDLKPGNVLLDQDLQPRLADFGQARLTNETSPALGTLFYMAPEQADLQAVPDVRWDVYALGALMYCMLTGEPPYRSAAATEIVGAGRLEERLARYRRFLASAPRPTAHRNVPGVDAPLAEVIDRCLSRATERRFPNVQAVLHALEQRRTRLARRPLLVSGIIGPLLLVFLMGATAILATWWIVGQVANGLTRGALESNGLAARSVSERFALEIDRRFDVLEREAGNARLQGWLKAAPDKATKDAALGAWIEGRRHYWNEKFPEETQAALWFVDDYTGRQRACSPANEEMWNQDFSWRDYFHGQGRNLPEGGPRPPPIRRPHRSMVYQRRGEDRPWSVAFSVPVFDSGTPGSGPIGVLGMTSSLGAFTRFRGSHDQFAVLIDLRPDELNQRGLVLEHPDLEQADAKDRASSIPTYYSPEVVALADQLWPDASTPGPLPPPSAAVREAEAAGFTQVQGYRDPIDNRPSDRWLATVKPVLLSRLDMRQTGWVVVVQEDQENTLQPLRDLRWKLTLGSVAALVLFLLVITGLWAFVLLVLGEARGPRLVSRLREKLGLSSGLPGSSAASAPSGSSASAHSEPGARSGGPAGGTSPAQGAAGHDVKGV